MKKSSIKPYIPLNMCAMLIVIIQNNRYRLERHRAIDTPFLIMVFSCSKCWYTVRTVPYPPEESHNLVLRDMPVEHIRDCMRPTSTLEYTDGLNRTPDPYGDTMLLVGAVPEEQASILVSSKVLNLASPAFAAMLSPRFARSPRSPRQNIQDISNRQKTM